MDKKLLNCVIIAHSHECLMFCKNDKELDDVITYLKNEFKLTDEGDLYTFLGVLFKKDRYKKL